MLGSPFNAGEPIQCWVALQSWVTLQILDSQSILGSQLLHRQESNAFIFVELGDALFGQGHNCLNALFDIERGPHGKRAVPLALFLANILLQTVPEKVRL